VPRARISASLRRRLPIAMALSSYKISGNPGPSGFLNRSSAPATPLPLSLNHGSENRAGPHNSIFASASPSGLVEKDVELQRRLAETQCHGFAVRWHGQW